MTLAPTAAPEDVATAASAAREAIAALFDPEFQRVLRRFGDRRRGDAADPTQNEAAARAAVWSVVADSGALWAGMAGSPGAGLRAVLPIIELMGESLYQSSYLDTLAAVDAISCLADPAGRRDLLDGAAAGEVSFALAALEPGVRSPRKPGPVRYDPASGRISGVRGFVRCADSADHLLVAAGGVDDGADDGRPGPLLALVPCDQPGVTLRRQEELGRAELFEVCLDGAEVLLAEYRRDPHHAWWAEVLDRAQLRHAGYLLGLCRASLSLTLARVKERSVFGRPLGAHQVPAFRLAALAARLEAVRSLVYRSCAQADRAWLGGSSDSRGAGGSGDVATASARSLLLATELVLDVTADSLQLHGAPGLIESSDAQLFYRRALTESMLFDRSAARAT